MAKPTKRLGRGLDSLVSNLVSQLTEETVQPTPITPRTPAQPPRKPNHRPAATETRGNDRTEPTQGSEYPTSAGEIPLTLLSPNPYQPRKSIDPQDLQELADSLRVNGMINPITVRRSGSGFQIIAGERRWQAAKLAGLQTVPVSIKSADDRQMHELALVENIQRQDLNAIDRAKAYQEYCRKYRASADDIAKRLGENRTTVTNYLRLLDLPDEVQSLACPLPGRRRGERKAYPTGQDDHRQRPLRTCPRGAHSRS
jgi:ParB family chromosome partitioning protein